MKFLGYYMKKIIQSQFAFKTWIKLNFLEKKIKYGEFQISGKKILFIMSQKKFYQESMYTENLH